MHGNPDGGTKWNWVCDPLRPPCACPSVCARARNTGASAYGTTEENYWFSFTPAESCPVFHGVVCEGKKQALRPRTLGRLARPARSPCIRSGRQRPRVSEPAVPSGNRATKIERMRTGAGETKWISDRAFHSNFDTRPEAGGWHTWPHFDAGETCRLKLTEKQFKNFSDVI